MTATVITLRPALPVDASALAALGRDSFIAKFGAMYRPEDLAAFVAEQHSPGIVAAQLADPLYRIAFAQRDGAPVGYFKLVLACGWPEHARGTRAIELKQLYTAPGATGGGIGAALMDGLLAEARAEGADEIQLSVFSENTDAQRFYHRNGFAKVADIHFMVGEQRDAEYLFARMI